MRRALLCLPLLFGVAFGNVADARDMVQFSFGPQVGDVSYVEGPLPEHITVSPSLGTYQVYVDMKFKVPSQWTTCGTLEAWSLKWAAPLFGTQSQWIPASPGTLASQGLYKFVLKNPVAGAVCQPVTIWGEIPIFTTGWSGREIEPEDICMMSTKNQACVPANLSTDDSLYSYYLVIPPEGTVATVGDATRLYYLSNPNFVGAIVPNTKKGLFSYDAATNEVGIVVPPSRFESRVVKAGEPLVLIVQH
jgi:hypothetical protein